MGREVYVVSTSIIDELGAQLVNFGPRRKTFIIPTSVVSYVVENAGSSPAVKSFYDFLTKLFGWFEQPNSPGGVEATYRSKRFGPVAFIIVDGDEVSAIHKLVTPRRPAIRAGSARVSVLCAQRDLRYWRQRLGRQLDITSVDAKCFLASLSR